MGIVTTLLQNVGHGWLILGLGGGFSGKASDIFIIKFLKESLQKIMAFKKIKLLKSFYYLKF